MDTNIFFPLSLCSPPSPHLTGFERISYLIIYLDKFGKIHKTIASVIKTYNFS
jgi:hypothetical protein